MSLLDNLCICANFSITSVYIVKLWYMVCNYSAFLSDNAKLYWKAIMELHRSQTRISYTCSESQVSVILVCMSS